MDLTEVEDIKKRWQEYMEELHKKDLHDPDNHDDVITNLEADILESEVKWALEIITMNKASGGDGILVELFQILKDDSGKVLYSVGEGNGTPPQYSCLENPMDGGAWWAAVHGVAKSRTRLSDFTFTLHFDALEKEMATHSSVLTWRIPGMGEPGGLPSLGLHRVGHD